MNANRQQRRAYAAYIKRQKLFPTLAAPMIDVGGARCLTCLKLVDYESIVENRVGVPKNVVTLLCRCHGAEQRIEIDLGTESWDEEDVGKALRSIKWFNPFEESSL